MTKLVIDVWRTRHNGKEVKIEDLSDENLQKSLHTIQKRQLETLRRIKINTALETALEKEAKKRNLQLKSLALADNPNYSKEYKVKGAIIKTVSNSLHRKEKQLLKEQENEK